MKDVVDRFRVTLFKTLALKIEKEEEEEDVIGIFYFD